VIGTGKSILLASIFEKIASHTDANKVVFQYLSCDMVTSEIGDKSALGLSKISNTLMYQLYEHAAADEQNSSQLETCNKVFTNPKQDKVGKLLPSQKVDQELPNMAEALRQLSVHLNTKVVIAIDAVDLMSEKDQIEFLKNLESLVRRSKPGEVTVPQIRVIVSCRSDADFSRGAFAKGIKLLDIGNRNREDIVSKLAAELERIVSLTPNEKEEATSRILEEAGYGYPTEMIQYCTLIDFAADSISSTSSKSQCLSSNSRSSAQFPDD